MKIATVVLCAMLFHGSISAVRMRQIQYALRKHTYAVRVTGRMDEQTTAALQDIAKNHGWQKKSVPDSRVLMWLGLGPDYRGRLLNPDTAVLPMEVQ